VPGWARGPKVPLLINARADTVAEKPAFRDAFKRRRGLMLADGFYEWQQPAKQPYYFRRRDGRPFAFAAIWEPAHELGGIGSAALITTEPNALVGSVHDRMSALLTADDAPAWLDSTTEDPAELLPLLRPYDATDMESWPVSKFVSNARNEAPECVEPI
jgi:putative SOS response-associated peptidase YedK